VLLSLFAFSLCFLSFSFSLLSLWFLFLFAFSLVSLSLWFLFGFSLLLSLLTFSLVSLSLWFLRSFLSFLGSFLCSLVLLFLVLRVSFAWFLASSFLVLLFFFLFFGSSLLESFLGPSSFWLFSSSPFLSRATTTLLFPLSPPPTPLFFEKKLLLSQTDKRPLLNPFKHTRLLTFAPLFFYQKDKGKEEQWQGSLVGLKGFQVTFCLPGKGSQLLAAGEGRGGGKEV